MEACRPVELRTFTPLSSHHHPELCSFPNGNSACQCQPPAPLAQPGTHPLLSVDPSGSPTGSSPGPRGWPFVPMTPGVQPCMGVPSRGSPSPRTPHVGSRLQFPSGLQTRSAQSLPLRPRETSSQLLTLRCHPQVRHHLRGIQPSFPGILSTSPPFHTHWDEHPGEGTTLQRPHTRLRSSSFPPSSVRRLQAVSLESLSSSASAAAWLLESPQRLPWPLWMRKELPRVKAEGVRRPAGRGGLSLNSLRRLLRAPSQPGLHWGLCSVQAQQESCCVSVARSPIPDI